MKKERIAVVLLSAALVGTAAFGVTRALRVGELDAQVKAVSGELADARESLQGTVASLEERLSETTGEVQALEGQLRDMTGERDGLQARLEETSERLKQTESQLQDANGKLEALSSAHPFDPEGPDYQKLYPDFYAPQPLDASQAPEGVIYLTFDDGPSKRTDEVLKTLERENIKATFFIVGRSGNASRDRLRAIAAAGHTVGMHSWSHDYKTIYASVEAFLADMYKVFCLIRDETGTAPTFFRFPGGSTNAYSYGIIQEIITEMLRRGFVPCDWNMSAQDATKTPLAVDKIISNVLASGNVARGVVLMHDSSPRTTTSQALPALIEALRERGYTFAALTPEVKPVVFQYRKPALEG